MNKIAVSVIVPVFNAERYLDQNIQSIISQDLKNIEIIYVDDGSTDNSVNIINNYIKLDNRIRLIKQKNCHAGVARNNGFKISKGEYVLFLDSDDFFESNMVSSAYHTAKKYNAEVVVFGYWYYDNKIKTDKKASLFQLNGLHSPKDYGKNIFKYTEPVPWNKLVKKSHIVEKNIYFQSIKNGNDEYFSRAICLSSERIVGLKKRFVHYRINNDKSLSSGPAIEKNQEDITCFLNILTDLKRYMIDNEYYNNKDYFCAFIDLANTIINYRITKSFNNFDNLTILYNTLKTNLVPNIFDSNSYFEQNYTLFSLYNSENVNEFLCSLALYYTKHTISKKSREYKIGKFFTRKMRILNRLF